ncbi:chromate transporter [Mesomycoplasma ovipneumoniae]|uniref:Chromate transporter n=1 Tax=Mesomycoplasma ovipneumoniae TaxID=29562 RepID=A0AAJ2UD32_9BACT|nr:chromate transporter [Mesomycoplasma ovipneumoniae]MDW2829451.1 chromate transporter [Mesomycoplasma ovipneumoniae]MDW2852652.1 chromate transporter [Mesomycoplasma ovipneumoniae]MDW2871102.1 chromate transporter [Mesomycoplasma ovipneumoniae]MDW2893184.1 chromate transporter [Mesomycoplasma ovipneumoniae]
MILLISLTILGVALISLIVFGGGQVFMPVFNWFWLQLGELGLEIDQEKINQIFTVANSTPGVFSIKLAAVTGFLIADFGVLGWFLSFIFLMAFILPAIFLVVIWLKALNRVSQKNGSNFIKKAQIFRPAIIGIILALAFQLFINLVLVNYAFNSNNGYFVTKEVSDFISGWRLWVFILFAIFWSTTVFILYLRKVNVFLLIIIGISLSLISLQPWL